MTIQCVIEMPKGCTRRIHLNDRGPGFIDLGPLIEAIPFNNGVMPIHYGFIKDTINKDEGDEVDVLLFSDKTLATGDTTEARPIALLRRTDNDHKVIAVDTENSIYEWDELPEEERNKVLEYFSSHHPIKTVENRTETEKYIGIYTLKACTSGGTIQEQILPPYFSHAPWTTTRSPHKDSYRRSPTESRLGIRREKP